MPASRNPQSKPPANQKQALPPINSQGKSQSHKRPCREPTPPLANQSPEPRSEHPSENEESCDDTDDESDNLNHSNNCDAIPAIDPEISSLNSVLRHENASHTHENADADNSELSPGMTRKIHSMMPIQLNDHYYHEALEIVNTPGALGYFLAFREMGRVQQEKTSVPLSGTGHEQMDNPIAHERITVKDFIYSLESKECIRNHTKEALLRTDIDSYTRGQYKPGTSDMSLLTVTMKSLEALPKTSLKKLFPPGFADGNVAARKNVVSKVRDLQKHTRLALRAKLLFNIYDENGKLVTHATVPDLHTLAEYVIRSLINPEAALNKKDIKKKITPLFLVRIAHLRLQTLDHIFHPPEFKKVSQWILIDEKIQELKARGADHRSAWGKALMEKDEELFGQKKMFGDIDRDAIRMPTPEAVHERLDEILRSQANAASTLGGRA